MKRTALILGATGQDGAYLSYFLNKKNYTLHGSSRAPSAANFGALERLGLRGRITFHKADLTDLDAVKALVSTVRPEEIYHLAAQSSVGRSFAQPAETIASIAMTTLNVLEAVRLCKSDARVFNVGSSECYGHCEEPAKENSSFRPHSPYAAARVGSYWTAVNYREAYGLYVTTGILANHESPLRPTQFVTRKIIQAVKDIADGSVEQLKLGSLTVKRDWGWAPEFVCAYWRILQATEPTDYNIATGETNSLEQLVEAAFLAAGLDWKRHVVIDETLTRPSEFVSTSIDTSKIKDALGWQAQYKMRDVVKLLLERERDGGLGPLP